MNPKLNKKEIVISALAMICCLIVLLGVLTLMILINNPHTFGEFFMGHINGVITVFISMTILVIVIYFYFFFENPEFLQSPKQIAEVFILICFSVFICNLVGEYVSPTARPLLFCPLMLAMILSRSNAIFLNVVYALILFIFNRFFNCEDLGSGTVLIIESYASLLVIFSAGTIGIFLLRRVKTRLSCVMLAFIFIVPALIINIIMIVPLIEDLTVQYVLSILLYSALDCIFSVLLFMSILPVFEGLFSLLTPFRLRELTSDNYPLIKRLKENALGTYNHSVVVAQLVEACASAIGEDSELARAAAYYHDVGKLKNPEMFTENQSDYDLHKELTPELSVDIIRSHARDGAKLIKKHRLPEFFADIAVEHHGTMPIKYFYAKALKMSDGELNVSNYSYPGPTPTTKIAAIIMICDASEAATRSLTDRSPEKVEKLVTGLVAERLNLDQFMNCDITLRELNIVTTTLINHLTGVYHSRVQYPKLVMFKK